jgi:putative transposase
MLVTNTIIKHDDELGRTVLERVLYINRETEELWTIELPGPITPEGRLPRWYKTLPKSRSLSHLESALEEGLYAIHNVDPYARYMVLDSEIPEKYLDDAKKYEKYKEQIAKQLATRDTRYQYFESLIDEKSPDFLAGSDIFDPDLRGPALARLAEERGVRFQTAWHALIQYWQGGQVKNAVRPQLDRCGGRGTEREYKPHSAPIGRPRTIIPIPRKLARFRFDEAFVFETPIESIRVTAEIREQFSQILKVHYYKGASTGASDEITVRKGLRRTYRELLRAHYIATDDTYIEKHSAKPKSHAVVLKQKRPTLDQFYWYVAKHRDRKHETLTRRGRNAHNLKERGMHGESTSMAMGPGSLLQTDTTLVDLYLCSELNRLEIVGRPVIYVIIDVFSRLILGLAVTLEGPKWENGMNLAIANMVENKVAFCKRYGRDITHEQWPATKFGKEILGDRAELLSKHADSISLLSMNVGNVAVYRADWKGIIEARFHILNEDLVQFTPGYVRRDKQRGERDHRLDACLTLREFTGLIIDFVLQHNNLNRMKWYDLDEFAIGDNVSKYALDIWNWGIAHRSGSLKEKDPNIVRRALLPKETASITPYGLEYRGLTFKSAHAISHGWLEDARRGKRRKVAIRKDMRTCDFVYHEVGPDNFEVCPLVTLRTKSAANSDWYERMHQVMAQKSDDAAADAADMASKIAFEMGIDAEVEKARALKEAALKAAGPVSKASQTENIRDNRHRAAERDRQERLAEEIAGDPELRVLYEHSLDFVPSQTTDTDDETNDPDNDPSLIFLQQRLRNRNNTNKP